jgi:hypothetical protein
MNLSDEVLLTLIEWIMLSKDAVLGQYRENCGAPPAGPWLLSLIDDDSGHEIWKQLGMWLVERLRPQHGAAVVDGIQLFRAMLNPYA